MIESGLQPELLLSSKYGHQMHVWDLRRRRHLQALDLGKEQQMVLEMRPAHNPTKAYGFVSVVVSVKDLTETTTLTKPNAFVGLCAGRIDRKSTRLNSSHVRISY